MRASVRRWWRRRNGLGAGRRTRSSEKATAARCCPWWNVRRNTRSREGWQEDGVVSRNRLPSMLLPLCAPGPHDNDGQRQGVRGPCRGAEGARRRDLICRTVPLLEERPEPAHQRPGLGVLPEGGDFRQIIDTWVEAVQDRLNECPSTVLGYWTPAKVFHRFHSPRRTLSAVVHRNDRHEENRGTGRSLSRAARAAISLRPTDLAPVAGAGLRSNLV